MVRDIARNVFHQIKMDVFVHTHRLISPAVDVPVIYRIDLFHEFAIDPRLFADLAQSGLFRGFARVDYAFRKLPTTFARSLDNGDIRPVRDIAERDSAGRYTFACL